MQPRRLLEPLLLTVFHVTKSGYSSSLGFETVSAFLERRPSEKNEDPDDDLEVVDEVDIGSEGVEEFVEGADEEDEEEGLWETRRRLIAAGR
jgi:hypothetical protein